MSDTVLAEPSDPVDTASPEPSADPPADLPAAPAAEPASVPSEDWYGTVEDTKLRDHAGRFTSVVDLLGKHYELRQSLSTAIQPLGENPTDEQVVSYRKAIGVPETIEGYKFPDPPDGEALSDDVKTTRVTWAERFHTLNIPANTAAKLIEFVGEDGAVGLQAQIDADKVYADEAEVALKAEWPGKSFDLNKAHADRAAVKVFGDAFDEVRKIETKDGRFVLDNPAFVRMLAGIGREMSEGRLGTVMTEGDEAALDTEIDELEGQIDKATAEGDNVKANDLFTKQQELYRKKHGTVPIVGSEGRAA